MKGYYFITDRKLSKSGILNDVRSAEAAQACMIQYREKNKSSLEMCKEARDIRNICIESKLIINDRIDIALAVGADGVHLGQDDLPLKIARDLLGNDKIIGITVHNVQEAILAENEGADYIAVSPIYDTSTKLDAGRSIGLNVLKKIREKVNLPIVAIGGIGLNNILNVRDAGADCICAISAIVTSDDVTSEINKIQEMFL